MFFETIFSWRKCFPVICYSLFHLIFSPKEPPSFCTFTAPHNPQQLGKTASFREWVVSHCTSGRMGSHVIFLTHNGCKYIYVFLSSTHTAVHSQTHTPTIMVVEYQSWYTSFIRRRLPSLKDLVKGHAWGEEWGKTKGTPRRQFPTKCWCTLKTSSFPHTHTHTCAM